MVKVESEVMGLQSSVAQGLVLGPVFFLLFINDIPISVSRRNQERYRVGGGCLCKRKFHLDLAI